MGEMFTEKSIDPNKTANKSTIVTHNDTETDSFFVCAMG